MEIIELYKKLKEFNISPNEFVYLSYKYHNIKEDFNFNEHISIRILKKNEYLDKNGDLTDKSINLFNDSNEKDYIQKFRELFPKGILPNGRPARSTYKELNDKLSWFNINYSYSWDIILKATEEYVNYYLKQDYKFMQTASNFISKQNSDKIKSSALAEWCEKVIDGYEIKE